MATDTTQIQTRRTGSPQAHPAASSAASLAFQKSNPSLANAAAAAALRNNPRAPEDVANTYTKRIQRRESGSSAANGSPRPGLERRTSLTDRSLRSPSPGRDGTARQTTNAPPLPPLPQGVERAPSGRHRAASLEAPQRISSPPPTQPGGRGLSLDRAPRSPVSPKAASTTKPKLPKLSEHNETPQRTSVNFSRPMSPPPKSPISPTPPTTGQTGWFAGPVTSGGQPRPSLDSLRPQKPTALPTSEVTGIQTELQGIADQPVKKKKKRKTASAGGNQGTHLSQGTMDLTGTAVEQARAIIAASAVASEAPSSPATANARTSIDFDSSVSYVEHPEQAKTRVGAVLARQPSLIDEAPEYDQAPERANTGRKVEALPVKSSLDASRVAASSSPEPAPAVQPVAATVPIESFEPNGATVQRTSSLSPQRAARFSPKPVEYLGGIQHQPLGRSASPAKSALKHSPSSSVRTASPDVRLSAPPSEFSESSTSVAKKKANRVSFDETPIIVSGLQTSRYANHSPPRVRGMDDDLEDIMKPRPALPSFGSVRGRKEEDAAISATAANSKPIGHSSDHILGGILAQDFANRDTAARTQTQDVTAHDPNMPLAPEVTTVEGTGYASDSESEYSEHTAHNQTPQVEKGNTLGKGPETIAEAVSSFQTSEHVISGATQNGAAQKSLVEPPTEPIAPPQPVPVAEAPTIAIQPATPAAEEEKGRLSMPGSFPGAWDDDLEAQDVPEPAKDTTPAAVPHTQARPAQMNRQTHGIPAALRIEDESDTESDTSSIWSDAEEDLPSGSIGFASLNAIVDSPKLGQAPGLSLSKHAPGQDTLLSAENAPPSPTAAQWNDATAYWRGLSEQRKRELEQQAVPKESGVEESETEESSDDEDLEKSPSVQPARPETPPPTIPKQRLKLESPIAFATKEAPIASKIKKVPNLRSTMRQGQLSGDDEAPKTRASLRSSMKQSTEPTRNSGEHRFRTSMRGAPPTRPDHTRRYSSGLEESKWKQERPTKAAEALRNGRPRTAGGAAPALKSALKKTVQAPPVPTLRRQDSDDSVSSFRRQRVTSPGRNDGIVSMRRSMKGGPAAHIEQRPQSPLEKKMGGLFRLRSLPPAGREKEVPQMRSSMRGASPDVEAPSLRSQEPPKKASRFKSPTRLGFGKSKSKIPESPRTTAPVAYPPRFKSRIAADSDDEEVPPTSFVSRFADSDDEPDSPQLTKTLTPVRGIPRKTGEDDGDSTDLDDSDNERAVKIPPVPSSRDIDSVHGKKTMVNGNRPASILSTGSLRKGGDAGLGASKFANAPPERPQQKRRLSWLGMGGSKKRSSSMPPSITSPPPSRGSDVAVKPNLLRRSTPTGLPQISEDSNWPLASPGDDAGRPSIADGPGTKLGRGTLRPDVGKRRSTADYVGSERIATTEESVDGDAASSGGKRVGFNFESGEPVYSERTGRKKKFGTLRKMFGLHD